MRLPERPPAWLAGVLLAAWVLALGAALLLSNRYTETVPAPNEQTSTPRTLTGMARPPTSTLSPTPIPTPALPVRIEPWDPDKFENQDLIYLGNWIPFYNLKGPGEHRFPGLWIPLYSPVEFYIDGWCAKTDALLEEYRQATRYHFFVEGKEIPVERHFSRNVMTLLADNKTYKCFYYTAVLFLQPDKAYFLTEIVELQESVFDMGNKYSPGIYRYDYLIRIASSDEAVKYRQQCRKWAQVSLPTSWNHVYCDDMNGDFYWWGLGSESGQNYDIQKFFLDGHLVWRITYSNGFLSWEYPGIASLSESFYFGIDVALQEGPSEKTTAEIKLFSPQEESPRYYFAFRQNGQYRLYWFDPNTSSWEGDDWRTFTTNEGFNNIAVLADKGQATFFINGEAVRTIQISGDWIPALAVGGDADLQAEWAFDHAVYATP